MTQKVFLSFHYKPDVMRVSAIKQMGALEEQPILEANEWEAVKKKGDAEIEKYIAKNMKDKDCVIVLIGSDTAGRKWVKHEILKAWEDKKGLMGVYIHNIKDPKTGKCTKGKNPFSGYQIEVGGKKVGWDTIVPVYDPKAADAYNDIDKNIESWIKNAIAVRKKY